jgi:pimeloyl-ACP methyl ester carboxylesterase
LTPSQELERVEARAQRIVTGEATVWRRWGEGRALVLLHGGAGSWTHWIRNIDALAADRALWIPDLPGLGESAPPPAPRDHTAVAAVLARDVDALLPGGERFDLAGFSFGGIVAAFVAGLRPGRVRTQVLGGAGGLGLRKGQASIVRSWRHLSDPAERAAVHRHNLGVLMFSGPERIDPLALHLYTRDLMRARINSARSSRANPLGPQLATLRSALHGIWGRLDVTARGRFGEIEAILRGACAGAQLRLIEDAGHWVQYEQPDAFSAELRGLLG